MKTVVNWKNKKPFKVNSRFWLVTSESMPVRAEHQHFRSTHEISLQYFLLTWHGTAKQARGRNMLKLLSLLFIQQCPVNIVYTEVSSKYHLYKGVL